MNARAVIMRRVARLVSNLVYREIDVWVDPTLTGGGPIIAVSNHFGGLADGVLLIDAIPSMPRIVARDVIWKIPVVGQLATALGGIPVHRRADGTATSNDEMFASCYEALSQGDTILIFPEGVTQDVPHIAPVKTGAARIALGAKGSGVAGIRIVPVGLHYEDKAIFRGRVLVNAGPALDLDNWIATRSFEGASADRDAVDALTSDITDRLRAVAPDFPDWPTAQVYSLAAQLALHDVDDPEIPVRYGDVQLLASQLHRSDADGHVAAEAQRYQRDLVSARTADETVARYGGPRSPSNAQARRRDLLLSIVLLPYALLGALIGLVPWLVVQAVRLIPAAPAVRATITPALATIAFGLEWLTTSWLIFREAGASVGAMAFLLIPVFLAATVFVAERLDLWWRQRHVARPLPHSALVPLSRARRRVSDLVWERM